MLKRAYLSLNPPKQKDLYDAKDNSLQETDLALDKLKSDIASEKADLEKKEAVEPAVQLSQKF